MTRPAHELPEGACVISESLFGSWPSKGCSGTIDGDSNAMDDEQMMALYQRLAGQSYLQLGNGFDKSQFA